MTDRARGALNINHPRCRQLFLQFSPVRFQDAEGGRRRPRFTFRQRSSFPSAAEPPPKVASSPTPVSPRRCLVGGAHGPTPLAASHHHVVSPPPALRLEGVYFVLLYNHGCRKQEIL